MRDWNLKWNWLDSNVDATTAAVTVKMNWRVNEKIIDVKKE